MDAARIAGSFGLAGPVSVSEAPVARGKQGVVWRLDTADGTWAVKVPFVPAGEAEVHLSATFQEAAYDAGVPTPRVRRTPEGHVFADVDGNQVRLYEWVDLLAPDSMLDPALVGATVAAIHRIGRDARSADVDEWYRQGLGAQRWDTLVEQLSAAGAPFVQKLADLRDELVALESWIEPPDALRICHRDLWADNVLPTTAGGLCVIDWENSGATDPSQELACVLFEFGRTDPGRARALADAYRGAAGPAHVDRRGHFSMLIAELGHITQIASQDWLEPNERSPDRAESAAWVTEVLDDPHTRVRLDRLLASVR